MLFLRLDGQDFEAGVDYEPLTGWTIGASFSESKITRLFGQSATFMAAAYDYIYNKLVKNPNRYNERIVVEVVDSCCENYKFLGEETLNTTDGVLYVGQIDYKSIDWCEGSCAIKAKIVELNPDVQAATCLQTTYVFDDRNGFQNWPHPFVKYCIELRPGFIQDLMFIFGLLFYLIMAVIINAIVTINLIIVIVNVVISVLSLGYATLDELEDTFDGFLEILDKIRGYISGCDRGHPAPLIRDYIRNVCEICGLSFQSSILNTNTSPYYNALWLEAPVRGGTRDYVSWIGDNKPLMTGESMLDSLTKIFNGRYVVRNGVLIFERKDYFTTNTQWIDGDPNTNLDIIEVCYRFPQEQDPAYTSYEVTQDGVDWVGNEAKNLYNDIVEWKTPFSSYPQLKGERKQILPFAPARFRRDAIDRDVISDYYDLFDSIGLGFILVADGFDNALLLPVELTFNPKILVWDGTSDYKNAQIVREEISAGSNTFYYNIPMWVAAGSSAPSGLPLGHNLTQKPYKVNNLFNNCWWIDDPRLFTGAGKEFKLRIKRRCIDVQNFGFDAYILMPPDPLTNVRYRGIVEEIQISDAEISVSGYF